MEKKGRKAGVSCRYIFFKLRRIFLPEQISEKRELISAGPGSSLKSGHV